MTHLAQDELIALAEETASRHPHLEACATCRAAVDQFRDVLAHARAVHVPEPSPLFWDHFSQRVHAAVEVERFEPAGLRFTRGWWPSLAGALAVILIGFALTMKSGRFPETATPTAANGPAAVQQPAASATEAVIAQDQTADDPTWAFMGDLTSQIDWEHVEEAGLMPTPGSADLVLQEMTIDEQRVLLELLQQEMRNAKQL